jgi:hypothetical protein
MREIRTPGSTGHEAHSPLPISAKLVQPPDCNVLKQHNTITNNWQPGSDAILRKSLAILGIWNGKALPPATFPQPVSSDRAGLDQWEELVIFVPAIVLGCEYRNECYQLEITMPAWNQGYLIVGQYLAPDGAEPSRAAFTFPDVMLTPALGEEPASLLQLVN